MIIVRRPDIGPKQAMNATGIIPTKLKNIIVANESYRSNLNTDGPSVPAAKTGIIIFVPT
jgi:hypothetical protein